MKKILTNNGKILTNNGKILVANVEGNGGGLIEVTELPDVGQEGAVYKLIRDGWVGTKVPNTGYVENVYLNTKLSIEEVVSLLSSVEYYTTTTGEQIYIMTTTVSKTAGLLVMKLGEIIIIINSTGTFIFSNTTDEEQGITAGWASDFSGVIEVNDYLVNLANFNSDNPNVPVGKENDKLTNLISTTPFFEAKEEYYLYENNEWVKISGSDPNLQEKEVTENGEYVADEGYDGLSKVTVNVEPNLQEKEVTPSKSSQTITPDTDYDGLSKVTVEAIPDEYIIPNLQEKEVTENGEYVADSGYDGLSKVTVNVASSGGGGSSVNPIKLLLDGKKDASYLFRSFSGESVKDIISFSDTENVTNMSSMFNGCSALTAIPQLDTSNVTNMSSMFNGCSALTAIPQLDTSNVINMSNMFYKCSALTAIPQLDTSNVTNMSSMFANCTKITKIPQLDTSIVDDMDYMFANCTKITKIPQLDMIKVTSGISMFTHCKSLTKLTLLNIKVNLVIGSGTSYGHLLTLESLINTVKELINVGSAKTLTMGTANLEKIASTYVKFTDSSVTTIPTNEKGDVVVCESTDEGAMLLQDYALLKNWTLA